MTPGKGSKYREFYDLSGRITCMEQTMMGWSPRCYIPSFMEISLLVPEKKIFKGFLPHMGMAAIMVM